MVFGCMLAQASPAIIESETTLMFADSAFNWPYFIREDLLSNVESAACLLHMSVFYYSECYRLLTSLTIMYLQRFPALAMDKCLYIYKLTDCIQVIFTEEI